MEPRTTDVPAQVRGFPGQTPFDAGAVIRALSRPRMTGGPGADAVEADLRARFEALGFQVRDLPFHFSMMAGRFTVSNIAAVYTLGVFVAMLLLISGMPAGAFATLVLTVALMLAGVGYMRRNGLEDLPWGRSEATNLWIQRPGARPRYVFMAHRDSKSQFLPLSFRGPVIVIGILAFLALAVLAFLSLAQYVGNGPVLFTGLVAFVCGLLLVVSWAADYSPGALDNASGLATLLGIAAREKEADDVAFLITDAEELGLAGARAIAPRLPPVFGVINVDGIDDEGRFIIAERFGWPRPSGLAPHLAAAILGAASSLGLDAQRRDVPFGIMLDHMPIVKAGTPALSVLRGTLGSLHRIHRPADSPEHLNGAGVMQCVDLLCGALGHLRAREAEARPAG
ncbi:MAG TPA: M28 family peptidase [Longimicrobiales bacterium]|nr:M28 family peptidase [Longimicrobiales bacterium]